VTEGAEREHEHEADLVELVAACLARIDDSRDPPSEIVDAFCRDHPAQADALRRRLAHLERAGLAAERARGGGPLRLGRFELKGELGRGGMGVVYDAYDPRLQRRVALKALGARLVISDRARARFEREIRAVAALNHPRIVPVYEVGEENGIPWYTMELIEGRTLAQVIRALKDLQLRTDELSSSHLNQATLFDLGDTDSGLLHDSDSNAALPAQGALDARAPGLPKAWGKTYVETACRLVHDIADALDHAHKHGIVHRDVKPSNVLVDSRGRALLFDFGLARIDTDDALTLTGDFAGTPFYVAPEQISGKRGVDHRADVYSLGVTLFELLTLRRPFSGRNSQQVFRQILAKDPPLLRRINKLVPRDLETVCLTALEKDPERRYQSAGELAADLRRFLEFRPVRARPVGVATRAARWSRRNPAFATAIALGALIAVGVPAAVLASNVFLAREAERTARQAEKAEAINRFLLDLLGTAHPAELGIDGTIRDALALAAARVETDLADSEVQAGILAMIGSTYLAVGENAAAEPLLREALALRRRVLAPGDPELIKSLGDLGLCRQGRGDLAEAGALFTEALDAADATPAVSDAIAAERVRLLRHLALLRADQGEYDRAKEHVTAALQIANDLDGPNSAVVAASMLDLGEVFEREGRARGPINNANNALNGAAHGEAGPLDRAKLLYEQALARLTEAQGPDHPDTQACRERLAELLMRRRELDPAIELFARNADSLASKHGERNAAVARTRMRHALAMHLAGHNDQAQAEARAALAVQLDVLPAGHLDIASSEVVLAQILLDARLPEEAARLLEDSAAIRRARGLDLLTADSLQRLARSYYDQVRLEETLEVGLEALGIYRRIAARDGLEAQEEQFVAGLSRLIGLTSMGLGNWDDARLHLAIAAAGMERERGANAAATIVYRHDLANVLFVQERWGDAADAYRASLDARRRRGELDVPDTVTALANLAEADARLGRAEAAIRAAREAVDVNARLDRGPSIPSAHGMLIEGRVLLSQGRREEALEPLRQGVIDLLVLGGAQHRALFDAARLYGRTLYELGRYDEAEARLLSTLGSARAILGVQHPDVRAIAQDLIALYERLEQPEESALMRGELELSLKLRDSGVPPASGSADDEPLGIGPD
jgi:serine/threonine protein kinase